MSATISALISIDAIINHKKHFSSINKTAQKRNYEMMRFANLGRLFLKSAFSN